LTPAFVIWKTDNKLEIIRIIKLFKKYPPLATRISCQLAFLKKCLSHNDIDIYFKERNSKFLTQEKEVSKNNEKFTIPHYFPAWLSGFIEAEGCFTTRPSGKASFSIGQNNDFYLLAAIGQYFNASTKAYNRKGVFYLIEIYRYSTLMSIINHCSLNPLLGSKADSLELFKTYINRNK
jgi:hypothetical protein